ncbi:MAG: hypothetical protein HYS13_14490 [Planctomycetia bacterium]|nr:hypothetical protein [Planctomycetia bacterium]
MFVDRRFKRSLAGLVLIAAVMIVVAGAIERPGLFGWLTGKQAQGPQEKVDTRLQPAAGAALDPDVFIARADAPVAPDAGKAAPFPGVDPNLVSKIQDDTLWLWKRDEGDVHLHLLAALRAADDDALAGADRTSHLQLFNQPDVYRARPVRIKGIVRRTEWRELPGGKQGIVGYYHVVVQPEDNHDELIFVHVLRTPSGFPTRFEMNEPVEVSGLFYRRLAYRAQDALRVAPLVLARTVQWQPLAAGPEPAAVGPFQIMLILLGTALLALFAVRMALHRRRRELPEYVARYVQKDGDGPADGKIIVPEIVAPETVEGPPREPGRPAA